MTSLAETPVFSPVQRSFLKIHYCYPSCSCLVRVTPITLSARLKLLNGGSSMKQRRCYRDPSLAPCLSQRCQLPQRTKLIYMVSFRRYLILVGATLSKMLSPPARSSLLKHDPSYWNLSNQMRQSPGSPGVSPPDAPQLPLLFISTCSLFCPLPRQPRR